MSRRPLHPLPSYLTSSVRNGLAFDILAPQDFNAEAPQINADGPERPDRSQEMSDTPQDADRRKIPHHVKAGDARREQFGDGDVVGHYGGIPVVVSHDIQEAWPVIIPGGGQPVVVIQEPGDYVIGSIRFTPPLGPDDPVPVTELPDGTVRLDVTPQEIYTAAQGEFHSRDQLFFKRLEDGRVLIRKGVAETILEPETWASAVAHVSARGGDGTAYSDAFEVHMVNTYGYWKGEELLSSPRPGEGSVVLASLSDDVERIKACREPRTPSPDPQCSGPGYAHAPHGNCMGYGTDRT